MNKDKIGIIKYLSILVVEMFLPLIWFAMFFVLVGFSESNSTIPDFIGIVLIIIFCLLPIVYFLLPIVITILAIKQHWSCYLDKFFNQLKIPTIIFAVVVAVIVLYENLHIMIDFRYSRFWVWLYEGVIPPYCLIYLVILIHNICKKINKLRSSNTDRVL